MNNTENNVAAQAGNEPMRAAKAQEQKLRGMAKGPAAIMYGYGALMTAAAETIERLAGQVSPRATADVERDAAIKLLRELLNMRDIAETYASGAMVSDEFQEFRDRVDNFLATTKPGA